MQSQSLEQLEGGSRLVCRLTCSSQSTTLLGEAMVGRERRSSLCLACSGHLRRGGRLSPVQHVLSEHLLPGMGSARPRRLSAWTISGNFCLSGSALRGDVAQCRDLGRRQCRAGTESCHWACRWLSWWSTSRLRGTVLFRTLYFLPVTVSVIVVGQIWGWIYQGDVGVLNNYLGLIWPRQSEAGDWLGDPNPGYLLSCRSLAVGRGRILDDGLSGGLADDPAGELLEVAQIDGASPWQRFRTIVFPLLLPQTVTLTILGVLGTLSQFTHSALCTDRRRSRLSERIALALRVPSSIYL